MDPYQFVPSSKHNSPYWTTNSGAPVWNNNSSLTVGPRGPVLLEDYHLIEKLANFDRERIPERVTPLITRFSTVIHERGSPETIRDPRGFAVKFYTREGNFDIVGNNTPVFFIRDAIQFPDVIHAFKPNPKTNIQEYWRVMDFLSHFPESLHTFMFLFDDWGIPSDYRHMEGFGVHTYKLINKAGKETFIKWHWKPSCGLKFLLDEEAIIVGGTNHSHATQDLYENIAAGNYPEWALYIQTMDPSMEDKVDFDPLDTTKTWPEDLFPLQPVGKMVLNKNIDNHFAENEMLAFSPGTIVPGIYYSNDKMFQTRIFAYGDTQRHRLGPNFLQLPVNAPKCPKHNNHHEGFMNFMHRDEEVNYFPSRHDPVRVSEKTPVSQDIISGKREKVVIYKENNFKQPGVLYRTFDTARQERFIKRFLDSLKDPRVTDEVRKVWVHYCAQADQSLGKKMAQRLNMPMIQSGM